MLERVRKTYRTILMDGDKRASIASSGKDFGYGSVPVTGEKQEFSWVGGMIFGSTYLTVMDVKLDEGELPVVYGDRHELRGEGHWDAYRASGLEFFQDWRDLSTRRESVRQFRGRSLEGFFRRLRGQTYALAEPPTEGVNLGSSRLHQNYFSGDLPKIGDLLSKDVKDAAGFIGIVPGNIKVVDILHPLRGLPFVLVQGV